MTDMMEPMPDGMVEPCRVCGKPTNLAEIWWHSGIVIPLCCDECYNRYWNGISAACGSEVYDEEDIMKDYFIHVYEDQIRRPGAAGLLEWLKGSDFFTAPASTRFHLSRPGGLVEHSVNVYERLRLLCEREAGTNPKFSAPPLETIAIVGLLHDVCKVGVYVQEPKNQKTYDPEKIAAAKPYQVKHDAMGDFIWETVSGYRFEDSLPYGHGEKSVYILSGFMKLMRDEAFAIRYHMGPWRDGEQRDAGRAFELYPLALLAHLADMQATYLDEAESETL